MIKAGSDELGEDNDVRNRTRVTTPWGRGASEYRPGIFIKRHFQNHAEACCSDIYKALTLEIERLNKERVEIDEKPLRRPNYSSFARYFHWFKLLELVEPVGRQEPAEYKFLQEKQYYQLTEKGIREERAWFDPVRTAHPELTKG